MHPSQYQHMKQAIGTYLTGDRHLEVLELGSATSPGQTTTHRSLFTGFDHSYFGVDVRDGDTTCCLTDVDAGVHQRRVRHVCPRPPCARSSPTSVRAPDGSDQSTIGRA